MPGMVLPRSPPAGSFGHLHSVCLLRTLLDHPSEEAASVISRLFFAALAVFDILLFISPSRMHAHESSDLFCCVSPDLEKCLEHGRSSV